MSSTIGDIMNWSMTAGALLVALVGTLLAKTTIAYSGGFMGSQSSLRQGRVAVGKQTLVMEDFGLFKGTKVDFEDTWKDCPLFGEVKAEKWMNEQGLRYRMRRTPEEEQEIAPLGPDIKIGPIELKAPRAQSLWELMGFTATSNNRARQELKVAASKEAKEANNPARKKWLARYGYPRLVGTGGIFYADQLSTDYTPMGGFNMGKSGVVWPVPEVVARGAYGGAKGWGMAEDAATKPKNADTTKQLLVCPE